jgi:hypothetical protein
MMWLTTLVVMLTGFSIFALAISRAEPPRQIQTSNRSSTEERTFERHSLWLRAIGYASIALAALLGSAIVLKVVG